MSLITLLTASSNVQAIPVCCSPVRLPAYLHESATFIASATPMTTRFPSAFICMAAILAASLVAFTSPRRQPVNSLFRAIQPRPCPIYGGRQPEPAVTRRHQAAALIDIGQQQNPHQKWRSLYPQNPSRPP